MKFTRLLTRRSLTLSNIRIIWISLQKIRGGFYVKDGVLLALSRRYKLLQDFIFIPATQRSFYYILIYISIILVRTFPTILSLNWVINLQVFLQIDNLLSIHFGSSPLLDAFDPLSITSRCAHPCKMFLFIVWIGHHCTFCTLLICFEILGYY